MDKQEQKKNAVVDPAHTHSETCECRGEGNGNKNGTPNIPIEEPE
jgi:hypothetical protein